MKNKKLAFTLAEILITLGVIGVIAAMTLPTLIKKYQQHETVNRLKQTYSILYNAVRRSESENGLLETWELPNVERPTGTNGYNYGKSFFEQYLKSYIIVAKECKYSSDNCWGNSYKFTNGNTYTTNNHEPYNFIYTVVLSNGAVAGFWAKESLVEVYIDINGRKGPNRYGKDWFDIVIVKSPDSTSVVATGKSGVYMYAQGISRSRLITDGFGCSTLGIGLICGALIMHDGWKISEDYPW